MYQLYSYASMNVLVLLQIPRYFPSNSRRLYLGYFNCARCNSQLGANVLCIVCITIVIVSNPSAKDSLRTILDSISTLTAEWFNLGVTLGLSYDTLKIIESNYTGSGDARRCQTEMVIAWLQMKDNSQPSWQSLASALSSPSVGRIEIATMIAAEHLPHQLTI